MPFISIPHSISFISISISFSAHFPFLGSGSVRVRLSLKRHQIKKRCFPLFFLVFGYNTHFVQFLGYFLNGNAITVSCCISSYCWLHASHACLRIHTNHSGASVRQTPGTEQAKRPEIVFFLSDNRIYSSISYAYKYRN